MLISAVPIVDPKTERNWTHIKIFGELPSPINPRAALRFYPSKLERQNINYILKLKEVAPGYWLAEYDLLEDILSKDPLTS